MIIHKPVGLLRNKAKPNLNLINAFLKQCSLIQSLHTCQVANQAGAYPGFCSTRELGVFLLLPGWDTSPLKGHHQY